MTAGRRRRLRCYGEKCVSWSFLPFVRQGTTPGIPGELPTDHHRFTVDETSSGAPATARAYDVTSIGGISVGESSEHSYNYVHAYGQEHHHLRRSKT